MDARMELLAKLMDDFARVNWDDSYSPQRGALSISGDELTCTVGGETIVGHASAPLSFLTGAWALIYAHENDGGYGHRVDGRVNRVWPNGAALGAKEHRLDEKDLQVWAKLWPGLLFSSELYGRDIGTPGHPHYPNSVEGAGRTTLTGVLKRVVKGAEDKDPLERLKVAEFIEYETRGGWSSTAEDAMMDVVEKPLVALADDPEPAIREVALLALETCAARCWAERAYGRYEAICRRLIDAGFNAHLQFARLAESAYAAGDIAEGDRLWAIATAGQNPHRTIKMSLAFDHFGDWSDMHTRILRQAGGANFAWSNGMDPNRPRNSKLEKNKKRPALDTDTAERQLETARLLLARAAEGAEGRLKLDFEAIRSGGKIRLGGGEFDPKDRRLWLEEIFWLQAQIALRDGNEDEKLRLMFKAADTIWRLAGEEEAFRGPYDETVVEHAAKRDPEALERLGMPSYLAPLIENERRKAQLESSDGGQEQLFWQRFMYTVRNELLDIDRYSSTPQPGEELTSGFEVSRDGVQMTITHAVLGVSVSGPVSTPVINALRAWQAALKAAHGLDAKIGSTAIVTMNAEDVAALACVAAETFAAGAEAEAIALYRYCCGTDPLVQPWPYNNPVQPLPLDQVPEVLRAAVARRSPLEETEGFAKVKPRGRRVEQLAQAYDGTDAATARYIGQCLRDACGRAGDSEIDRVAKSGPPLLLKLWDHPDPTVREIAMLAILGYLAAWRYSRRAPDASGLTGIADAEGMSKMLEPSK